MTNVSLLPELPEPPPSSFVERLLQPINFYLPRKLHGLYLIMYLVFLSHKMTQQLSSVMFCISEHAWLYLASTDNEISKYKTATRLCREEMYGRTRRHYYCRTCKNLIPKPDDLDYVCRCGTLYAKETNFFSALSIRHALTTFLQATPSRFFVDTQTVNKNWAIFRHCSGETVRKMNLGNDICNRNLAVDLFIDNAQAGTCRKKSTATLVQLSIGNVSYQISPNTHNSCGSLVHQVFKAVMPL